MPGIQKQKRAIGYQVLPIKNALTPRDIGDPAKARVDTLKWLKGEGPAPEHFSLLFPDDEEALDDYRKDLWVHPERAAAPGKGAHQFITEAGEAMNGLLKSEQLLLRRKLAPYIEGPSAGGQVTAAPYKQRRQMYEMILRQHYEKHPLTHRLSYRVEADRLLTKSGIKWRDTVTGKDLPAPQYDLIRKSILPPLLRELFPHLYHA